MSPRKWTEYRDGPDAIPEIALAGSLAPLSVADAIVEHNAAVERIAMLEAALAAVQPKGDE